MLEQDRRRPLRCTNVDIQRVEQVLYYIRGCTENGQDSHFHLGHIDSLHRAVQILKERVI